MAVVFARGLGSVPQNIVGPSREVGSVVLMKHGLMVVQSEQQSDSWSGCLRLFARSGSAWWALQLCLAHLQLAIAR